jgi:hypothetical protein
MSIINRILYIPEVETIIFSNIYSLEDFKALTLVNHYYHQIVNQNELYMELKSFCQNRQSELNLLCSRHILSLDKIHTEFIRACYYGRTLVAKYIYSNHNINLHIENDKIFRLCCSSGHLEVAQWLFELDHKIDIHVYNECVFKCVCGNGHLKVAQWLFELDHKIDIHVCEESIFRRTCDYGHLEVAKWLFELDHKIDIHVHDEQAFRFACSNGHFEIARWLFELDHKIDIHMYNEYIYLCLSIKNS